MDYSIELADIHVHLGNVEVLRVIAENAECRYIQIINFSGVENTKALEDIFEYNSKQFIRNLPSSLLPSFSNFIT